MNNLINAFAISLLSYYVAWFVWCCGKNKEDEQIQYLKEISLGTADQNKKINKKN